ncbi:enoyl-CoA hydratase/isomerase family protein [Sphingobium sp. HBC34]|uniref:Enoyl-CoA hydratase/isomerase family protein n=1 Tax=Sphingobium cyanobacteriorum TaxID=3063954 RepID=A0ABT8ZPA8_9SPHN|nr:enoyl-CoA hydratase/isomerase family protein [Sphingobium sp. HBC34]MDO7836353.1 enoyl-CoA hydratase/isomerase family protein [Sphingobium sp. HBC34]
MTEPPLLIERDGPVAILTLNNPARRNALSIAMRDALAAAIVTLGNDADCRALVLTGAAGHFCAGGDFQDFPRTTIHAARGRLEQGSATLMRAMVAGRTPIIAAVEGHCVGAGVSLAAACDQVVMARGAKPRCAFVSAGLFPDLAGLWAIPRRVGLGQAKRLTMLGRAISADEALRIGLADELAEDGGALEAAKALAHELAAQPPLAVTMMKAIYAEGLDDILRQEVGLQPILMTTHDHHEAIAAFYEKRPARFTGQ